MGARGCVECGWTGLHADAPAADIETVERHDLCETFDGDIAAARFYCWAHPRFRWIIYVDEHNTIRWVDPREPEPDRLPIIGEGEPVYVATADAAPTLAWDLVFGPREADSGSTDTTPNGNTPNDAAPDHYPPPSTFRDMWEMDDDGDPWGTLMAHYFAAAETLYLRTGEIVRDYRPGAAVESMRRAVREEGADPYADAEEYPQVDYWRTVDEEYDDSVRGALLDDLREFLRWCEREHERLTRLGMSY